MNAPDSNSQQPVTISIEKANTVYSNMCRGVMTAEEVILDFALNPNIHGPVLNEPLEVNTRVLMSFASAKRLYHLLHAMVSKHEETFGPVVLDVNERVKARQNASAPEAS